jgi:Putative auto-transporter adhesin, head GIN domain
MKLIYISAIVFAILFSSCRFMDGERIKGNGIVKTESRTAGTFDGINVSGNADVYVKQDSIVSIRIEAEENLLPYILTENKNGTLHIFQKEGTNLKLTAPIKIFVSGPSFSRFDASGACDFFSENKIINSVPVSIDLSGSSDAKLEIKAPEIKAELSGAGSITLKGETKKLSVDGSGSTDVNCFDMLTEETNVELSGAGDAEVFASVTLVVNISGAADVKYKGNPAVSKQISGAGSIKKVE